MSKLNIRYSEKFDIQRVIDIIKKIDWFVENKYNYKNFSFPKALDKEKLKSYSDEEIKNAVIAEYKEDSYKDYEKILVDNWEKVSKELKFAFLKSCLPYQDEYIIYLTRYGTGGSYNLPNIVVSNIQYSSKEKVLQIIIHEITHLAIEENIIKYEIGQAQKERIVDLFFIKNFPRRVFTQNVYMSIDTEKIDEIFDANFPNMKEIIERTSK